MVDTVTASLENAPGIAGTALVPLRDGQGGRGAAGTPSPRPQKGASKAPRRIVRSGIPDSILQNVELQRAIAECLPPNYSFEVPKTVWRLQQAKARTVALQFPEGLLMYATTLADILERFAGVEHCIILGDVAYGACCVDDITAQMLGADLLVHYGHSCLVPLTNTIIPCLYIFVGIAIDTPHLIATVARNFSAHATRLVIAGTVQFSAAVQQASSALQEDHGFAVMVPQSRPLSAGEVLGCTAPRIEDELRKVPGKRPSNGSDPTVQGGKSEANEAPTAGAALKGEGAGALHMQASTCGAEASRNEAKQGDDLQLACEGGSQHIGDGGGIVESRDGEVGPAEGRGQEAGPAEAVADALVFVADGRFHLEAMMIANPSLPAYRYDPFTRTLLREQYDHRGMRDARRHAVEAAQGAREWGVVLGTLGRQGNLRTLKYILESLEDQGRSATVFLVSELSPEKVLKLGSSIEAWVQIACPRLSIDWGEAFQVPVLTPFELSVAMGKADPWWAPPPLTSTKGPMHPLESHGAAPSEPEQVRITSEACTRCAGGRSRSGGGEGQAACHENCTVQETASCSRCDGGTPIESHRCQCKEQVGQRSPERAGAVRREELQERPYPMDYYAAAGGAWNSTYMPRPKTVAT